MKRIAGLVCWLLCGCCAAFAQNVRVMQWNIHGTLGNSASNNTAGAKAIARIVNFNQPDLLLFNEVEDNGVAANTAALTQWVTNNIPYLGTQPGVSFFIAMSSLGDTFERNGAISRYPIVRETTFDEGTPHRGLHSFQIQLTSTNLQVFHAHLKCCSVTADECNTRQSNAQFCADTIAAFAGTNTLQYIFAGDWNEDEERPQCTLTGSYHPITTIREGGHLVEFKPTNLSGNYRTWNTGTAVPTNRLDYILSATNRLSASSGYVFSSKDWGAAGLYTNAQNLATDNDTASDHYCVFANYTILTAAAGLAVNPAGDLNSVGTAGGPFAPITQTYTISNTGLAPLNWTANETASWLNLSPVAGTIAGGGSTTVVASVNVSADTLAVGTYNAVIGFTNATNGAGTTNRTVTLGVVNALGFTDSMESGTNGWTPGGLWHLASTNATCIVAHSVTHAWYYGQNSSCNYNTGGTNVGDLVSAALIVPGNATLTFWSWEDTQGTGTLYDKRTVAISTNAGAAWIPLHQSTNNAAAWYQVSIGLAAFAGKTAQLRFRFDSVDAVANNNTGWFVDDVTVSGPAALKISPATSVNSAGEQGGPFAPVSQVYALSNTGLGTLAWTATVSNNWLNLSLASGSLAEGNSVNITLVTNALTAALVGGLYSNAVSFVNLTNGVGNTSRIWEQLVRDGIPDAWRLQYFGHIDPRADDLSRAADDPDGDGFTNIQEYIAGTDPKDLSSRFRVIDISQAANGTVTLTWSAVATKTYRVQYKDDVTAITWTDLAGDVNATGATASKADSTASGTKRIYHVLVLP